MTPPTDPSTEGAIRVVYAGSGPNRLAELRKLKGDTIVLGFDRWDDYTYKTTFPTYCRLGGESVELGSIQILIEGQQASHDHLAQLLREGWNGVFPIPDTTYISVPADLSFYEQLAGHRSLEVARDTARILRDASLLAKAEDDDMGALALTSTEGFRKSLQRENGAVRAFEEGWKFFIGVGINVANQRFRFTSAMGNDLTLELRFNALRPLPYDINVLIGPNGAGKSQVLHHIVTDWLDLDKLATQGQFEESPNFSQVVVVSYSPFELFPVDSLESSKRKDKNDYRYFGLRGRRTKSGARAVNAQSRITISRAFPSADAAHSLLNCLVDDQRYGSIRDWSRKVATAERVLGSAIEFDYAAIAIDAELPAKALKSLEAGHEPQGGYVTKTAADGRQVRLIPIDSLFSFGLAPEQIRPHLVESEGVIFVKGDQPVVLSSGQRLFSYIVINILGAIRRNSLIIVDEPELFLHPNLEIAFLRMLKSILRAYGSKALIATHSLVAVREMPSDCVHVMERTKQGVVIKTPPFETFGGDIQRISSYVFGDKSVSKPFEDWIRAKLKEFGSAEQLLERLGDDINEEMIIQINAMGRGTW